MSESREIIRVSTGLPSVIPEREPVATIWGIPVYVNGAFPEGTAVLCYKDERGDWRRLPIALADVVKASA